MTRTDALTSGRTAYARCDWTDAYTHLCEAEHETPLAAEDLEHLATAAYLIGKDTESAGVWARAHQRFLTLGEKTRAVRCAFWLAFGLFSHGEHARGGAWIARGRRLLDEAGDDCVERGYLLLPETFERLMRGDIAAAYSKFCEAADIGGRFRDRDLSALARHSRGRVLIRMGEIRKASHYSTKPW